ncbi:MAG: cellulase family glycosylhydrolase [Planctomycetes bacterium]|nr:cellulase family glycosylhydrolase [Planctomycetota bacterium]
MHTPAPKLCVATAAAMLCCCAPAPRQPCLGWLRVAADGAGFVAADTGERWLAVGVNYDHDRDGRLLEDYWSRDWATVAQDFAEIRALGANVVRVHLQLGRFMQTPSRTDPAALARLARLVELADSTGTYLCVTGLGCYHAADVPAWYDAAPEAERWAIQARFWRAVARVCADEPAVFCYDLMNEPLLPGDGEVATEWLAGEFAGKHFVQRITLDLRGRSRVAVARDWVRTLVAAIRECDVRHPITVGVIPWSMTFPGAKPIFYAPEVAADLDFVSIHLYPRSGELDRARDTLRTFRIGKPLVVEEMFPLHCSIDELCDLVAESQFDVAGWMSFYWGRTMGEPPTPGRELADAITDAWLARFAGLARRLQDDPRSR